MPSSKILTHQKSSSKLKTRHRLNYLLTICWTIGVQIAQIVNLRSAKILSALGEIRQIYSGWLNKNLYTNVLNEIKRNRRMRRIN